MVVCTGPRILSLCSGYGGLDLGVELVWPGARTVCYVEREVPAAAILAANMEQGTLPKAPIWSDLTTFDARRWRGAVDIVAAGLPCQPWSVAGKGLGEADERHLWPVMFGIVRAIEPEAIVFENVANHLRTGFAQVARDLHGLGYCVAGTRFSALDVGAPHRRERVFALAVRPRIRGGWRGWNPADAHSPRLEEWRGIGCYSESELEAAERVGGSGVTPDASSSVLQGTEWSGLHGASRPRGPSDGSYSAGSADTESIRGVQGANDVDTARAGSRGQRQGDPESDSADVAGCATYADGEGQLQQDGPKRTQWRWARDCLEQGWARPAPEPTVRRMDDGTAPRVDRLRALGNGVVPQQAAAALKECYADLVRALDAQQVVVGAEDVL